MKLMLPELLFLRFYKKELDLFLATPSDWWERIGYLVSKAKYLSYGSLPLRTKSLKNRGLT